MSRQHVKGIGDGMDASPTVGIEMRPVPFAQLIIVGSFLWLVAGQTSLLPNDLWDNVVPMVSDSPVSLVLASGGSPGTRPVLAFTGASVGEPEPCMMRSAKALEQARFAHE